MWDETFGLPTPPIEALYPTTVAFWASVIFGFFVAAAFVYGLKEWWDTKRPITLLVLAGGFLVALDEPFIDILSACL
ncbi:MAG: hypothetical protein ABW034_26050, partial [Steroidobacteraceae bacterium]